MTGMKYGLSAAVLLTLFLFTANPVVSQSSPNDKDKIDVMRVVLEAELARQVITFENVRQLSTENITSFIQTGLAADLKLTPLSLGEINDKAHSYMGVRYLRLKDFNIEGGRAVVKLSVVNEMTPCFGPYQKDQQDFTYSVAKIGGHWKALIRNPPTSFTFGIERLTFGKSL